MLLRSEEISGSAKEHILLRKTETICGGAHHVDSFLRDPFVFIRFKNTGRRQITAPDTSAELMQSRKAESLRISYNHQRGIRIIHSDFDDGRGYQHIDLSFAEILHDLLLLRSFHLTVK